MNMPIRKWLLIFSAVIAFSGLVQGCKPKSQIGPTPTPKISVPGVVINQEKSPLEHVISVYGYGEILCSPDYSTITLAARAEADNKEEAYSKCEKIVSSVLDTARYYGVREDEIRIDGIHVDWSILENVQSEIRYQAESSIVVTAEDAEAADELLPELLEQTGAVLTDVTYTLKNYDQHYYAALSAAVENAHERALIMGKAAGLTLGQAVHVSEITDGNDIPLSADSSFASIPVVAHVAADYLIIQ